MSRTAQEVSPEAEWTAEAIQEDEEEGGQDTHMWQLQRMTQILNRQMQQLWTTAQKLSRQMGPMKTAESDSEQVRKAAEQEPSNGGDLGRRSAVNPHGIYGPGKH